MENNRFDRHKWRAKLYTSASEIDQALKSFAIADKKIKAIHVIGVARNMEKAAYTRQVKGTLADVGVPYEAMDSGEYPYLDRTLLPCKVEICEPVVFLFEDNSTLEVMPCKHEGLLMSTNQIPPHVLDGTNDHNFDATKLFGRIIGSTIKDVQMIRKQITNLHGTSTCEESRSRVKYQFGLSGAFGLFFEEGWDAWFEFGLTNQSCFSELGNKTAAVPYEELKTAAIDKKQITIVEGHDSSSYFWILPVKRVATSDAYRQGVQEYRQEKISIEEDDVFEFLYYFLDKYYDKNYPYGDSRDADCENCFQWNLEYNLYTYDTIQKMLDDMESCCALLKNDYNNEAVSDLKSRFSIHTFDPNTLYRYKIYSKQEKERLIQKNIYIATDFYERFIYRMRAMMAHAKDYDLISFMGP